jgi:hypothetical protein
MLATIIFVIELTIGVYTGKEFYFCELQIKFVHITQQQMLSFILKNTH